MTTLAQKREALVRKYEAALIQARIDDLDNLDIPFFTEPTAECGIWFRPVTLRMLRDLFASRSPFVSGGEPDFADTFIAAWYLSTAYRPSVIKRAWYYVKWRGKNLKDVQEAVKKRLHWALCNAPKPSGGGSNESPQYSWLACIIHRIASDYGWGHDEILDLPAGCAWQYYRLIMEEKAAKAGKKAQKKAFNYDRVMAQYLKELNELEAQAQ
jgi:hypothetical protein